ncbi:hypothetical protein RFI_26798 [Reticulomyxa filosa]|uniref:DUF1688 domain-containing protein n=1 Tax=Reticulomyxa filosa TaxID=46433 RepID=X6M9L4_RETFI|nr:hypothetical protein RFI_26798 [Reticulomyxa filosa]|eukprot:ETO10579.1 hypothetical protein RFI_26798 [Reticulomyxa filosa]
MKGDELIEELRDLQTIRKQCERMYEMAKQDKLHFFGINLDKIESCAKEVVTCIKKHYPNLNVPMHSRFRHFDPKAIENLRKKWTTHEVDREEQTRRLIDLAFISVLLDAGAGDEWKYVDRHGRTLVRSEGIGAASLQMFLDGMFSSDEAIKTRVNSRGLQKVSMQELKVGFQASKSNPLVGLDGRAGLLKRLAKALEKFPEYFGHEVHRPGHLLDFLLVKADKDKKVSLHVLWKALIIGLEPIWPQRVSRIRNGDVWSHNHLKIIGQPGSDMIPFHKLVQWLCYSIVEEFTNFGIKFDHLDDLTCLPEYRNGGLLIDTGVLVPKDTVDTDMTYHVGSELIVEWRALTVALIDEVAEHVRKQLGKTKSELSLSKILEGGTWRAGRELAYTLRPTGAPPIRIRSDGTVF